MIMPFFLTSLIVLELSEQGKHQKNERGYNQKVVIAPYFLLCYYDIVKQAF